MTLLVGVGGGSASGKSTLVRALAAHLPSAPTVIETDWYYSSLDSLPPESRAAVNFDHLDATDWALMIRHLDELAAGRTVAAPTYDYATHTRCALTRELRPSEVIMIDGLHVLACPALRRRLDLGLFLDTPESIRLQRRTARDREQRGRSAESVERQWRRTVQPMFEQIVEPSRRYADIVVPYEPQPERGSDTSGTKVRTDRRTELLGLLVTAMIARATR